MYLSLPKAAKRVGYSQNTLRKLVNAGRLKLYVLAGCTHPRVRVSELDALMLEPAPAAVSGADFNAIWDAVSTQWDRLHPKQPRIPRVH